MSPRTIHRIERRARGARVALLGELAVSIAHEVNQPLAAILANVDAASLLMRRTPPSKDDLRAILADIRRDVLRAGDIVRRVRELSVRGTGRATTLDLAALAADAVEVLKGETARRGARLDVEVAHGGLAVRGHRAELQQVLINFVINAFQAVESLPRGRRAVRITASRVPDGWAQICVSDAGPGLPPVARERLFESFFTTRRDGIGLGLAIARSIIDAHGGRLRAGNNRRRGATFCFALPPASRKGNGGYTSSRENL